MTPSTLEVFHTFDKEGSSHNADVDTVHFTAVDMMSFSAFVFEIWHRLVHDGAVLVRPRMTGRMVVKNFVESSGKGSTCYHIHHMHHLRSTKSYYLSSKNFRKSLILLVKMTKDE